MEGWLFKSSENASSEEALFSAIVGTFTSTLKLVGDNIWWQRWWCVLKNKCLFWYESKDSNKAAKYVEIKEIEEIEMHSKKSNVFYFLAKEKLYWLEADTADEATLWFKSLQLVWNLSEDYLDLNRYANKNVFVKTSGKSMYRPLGEMLEQERAKWNAEKEAREREW